MPDLELPFKDLQTQVEGLVLDIEASAKKRESILGRTRNLSVDNLFEIFPLIQEVAELELGESADQLSRLKEIQNLLALLQASSEKQIQSLHEKASTSSRQQNRLTVVLTIISLFIGWFLSFLGNPLTVLNLLMRK